ncbi:hypothetical protein LguiA_006433 [Lonicera macranthoides]
MMDKSCHSSGESDSNTGGATGSTSTTTSGVGGANKDHQYLMHLNKISHKISKPPIRKPTFHHHHPPPPPPPPPPAEPQSLPHDLQQQHQPPVYNINKSDFREVVQKLTGSPAHERFSTPPPIHPPKPQSSRLQRIRPPPLAQLSKLPPPLLNSAAPSQPNPNTSAGIGNTTTITCGNFVNSQRQIQPLSPLPPFPAVHAAAESPISAYMRYLQSSTSAADSDSKRSTGFSLLAPLQFPSVSSPVPFGCMQSPKSPYPLLSPSLLLSPTNQFGFQNFPLSPTLPVPSPTWKGH